MYLPWYVLQSLSLWFGIILLNVPYHVTYWQLLGFVITLRILRGIITKAGNVVTTEIMKQQIARDAWDQALKQELYNDQDVSDAEFKTWYKAYRKTMAEE